MELHQLTEIVTGQQAILSRMEEQTINTARRLDQLERASGIMTDVKIALSRIEQSNLGYNEKLSDLKVGIEKINNDNKVEHGAIELRLKTMEDVPGEKWGKISWYMVIAVVGAAFGYITNNLLK